MVQSAFAYTVNTLLGGAVTEAEALNAMDRIITDRAWTVTERGSLARGMATLGVTLARGENEIVTRSFMLAGGVNTLPITDLLAIADEIRPLIPGAGIADLDTGLVDIGITDLRQKAAILPRLQNPPNINIVLTHLTHGAVIDVPLLSEIALGFLDAGIPAADIMSEIRTLGAGLTAVDVYSHASAAAPGGLGLNPEESARLALLVSAPEIALLMGNPEYQIFIEMIDDLAIAGADTASLRNAVNTITAAEFPAITDRIDFARQLMWRLLNRKAGAAGPVYGQVGLNFNLLTDVQIEEVITEALSGSGIPAFASLAPALRTQLRDMLLDELRGPGNSKITDAGKLTAAETFVGTWT